MLKLINQFNRIIIITDIKYMEVSVLKSVKAEMFAMSKLEDELDNIVLKYGESLELEGVDEFQWIEP